MKPGSTAGGVGLRPEAVADEALSGLPAVADEALTETMIAAFDLLAHFWSRPVADELDRWLAARQIEIEMLRHLPASDTTRAPVWRPVDVPEMLDLLDEHERLFVGPGQVPCPPYESFWREDVPVDNRRSSMRSCAADLWMLYVQLGLELARSGELPDHLAVELEALAYALSLEGTEELARRLFTDHIDRWLPRFCLAVAQESQHAFYRELAALTLEWVTASEEYFSTVDHD